MGRSTVAGLVLLLSLSGCANATSTAARTLMDYSASQALNAQSDPFTTPGKWDLTYSWDCATARSQGSVTAKGFSFVVLNADDGSTAAEAKASVSVNGVKGEGTIHYQRAGVYTISVTSYCSYRLRVLNPNA